MQSRLVGQQLTHMHAAAVYAGALLAFFLPSIGFEVSCSSLSSQEQSTEAK